MAASKKVNKDTATEAGTKKPSKKIAVISDDSNADQPSKVSTSAQKTTKKSKPKTKSPTTKKSAAKSKPKKSASKPKPKKATEPAKLSVKDAVVVDRQTEEPEENPVQPVNTELTETVNAVKESMDESDYKAELAEDNLIFKDITDRRPKVFFKLLRTLLLLALFAAAMTLLLEKTVGSPNIYNNESSEELAQLSTIEGRYLLTGTTVWDRNIEEWSKDEDGVIDFAQPFSGLDSYNPDQYDAWVTDLECPISGEDVPYEVGLRTFEFNCRPEYLPYAAEYFEFINLANNHSDNSGRDKLDETEERLDAAGLQYFGDPDPSVVEDACEVVGLPVRQITSLGDEIESRMPVAFCGWHYFLRLPQEGEIEVLTRYSEVMPVFAFLHMGPEYETTANRFQVQTAREIIDAGADMVIANNPHWVQNAEVYNDKLIVYSTGNFIFDQTWSEEVGSSANIDVLAAFTPNDSTAAWLAMGEECMAYKDDCLQKAEDLNLRKQDVQFTYDLVAGDIRDKRQDKADSAVQQFVENRLEWPRIVEELGQI